MEAIQNTLQDPCAVAVVETTPDGTRKLLGDISTHWHWQTCQLGSSSWAPTRTGQRLSRSPQSLPSSPVEEISPGRSRQGRRSSAAGASGF
uniref:Uncharacterized protein n=1 Tax=Zea mays TaxID=4577 RepID=A0A804QYD6_MAIZE